MLFINTLTAWGSRRFGMRAFRLIAGLILLASMAEAHPGEQEPIRRVLLEWAHSVANADAEPLESLLVEGFEHQSFFGTEERDRYLKGVASGEAPMQAIDLRHARYTIEGERARVGDILGIVMQTTHVAAQATLVKVRDGWKIEAITAQLEAPKAAQVTYPEQLVRETVELRVVDAETGAPIHTRVHVRDAADRYWPPDGHMREIPTGWREDVGGDVVVAGKTWAYVPGATRLRLPAGRYSIEVTRGLEYTPQLQRFNVALGKNTQVRIALERWSNIREESWYSGDTHVHFVDPLAALHELQGEDLDVLNILASKWGALVTNVEHFNGRETLRSPTGGIVYVGEETRHGWLGHSILLGIQRLVYPLTWGGPSEGVPGGFDHPPMATQADAAHAQGGLVTAAHFPWPLGELAVDIALGKLDAVDVLTWGDAFSDENVMPAPPAAETWYRFLNCGFDLAATAGTDKMYNRQVSGSVRVYAKVAGDFSYTAWLHSIRAGRTFVSTAPMLSFDANGAEIGDTLDIARGDEVRVTATSRSRIPIEKLEILEGGRVVATARNPDAEQEVKLQASVSIEGSTWLAARAYSSEQLPYQEFGLAGFAGIPVMAHTSPVYISVGGEPRRSPEDARVLLGWVRDAMEWAQKQARFQDPSQRDEMVALFQRAERVYLEQLAAIDPTGRSSVPSRALKTSSWVTPLDTLR